MKDPSAAADVEICCGGAGSITLLLGSPADTTKVLWGRKKTHTHRHTHKPLAVSSTAIKGQAILGDSRSHCPTK